MKPSDCWTIPMCHECHHRQHQIGEVAFHGDIDRVKGLAELLWRSTGLYEYCVLVVCRYRRENAVHT